MSNKISHARIQELEQKKSQLQMLQAKIEQVQQEMDHILRQMEEGVAEQMKSSSTAAQAKRDVYISSLELQDEVEALKEKIDELNQRQSVMQEEIDLLQGWG